MRPHDQILKQSMAYVTGWHMAIDVGAHVGDASCFLADHFKHVVAVEQQQENYLLLMEHTPANVIPVHATASWCVHEGDSVPLITLDSLRMDSLGFLKIGTQGREVEVLMGAEQLLKRCNPVVMAEEPASERLVEWGWREVRRRGKHCVFVKGEPCEAS